MHFDSVTPIEFGVYLGDENMDLKNDLERLIEALMTYKGDCAFKEISDTDTDSLTMKQVEYLKVIDDMEATTISNLAAFLELTKPTVTESVKRLQKMDCVAKHRCSKDGRIQYITLTERGERIARVEAFSTEMLVNRILLKLNGDETRQLIVLLEKITDES